MHFRLLLQDENGLSRNVQVKEFCENLYESGVRSPFLLALIVDMCDEQLCDGNGDSKYNVERAKDICNDLAKKYDTVRSKYWDYMLSTILKKTTDLKENGATGSS